MYVAMDVSVLCTTAEIEELEFAMENRLNVKMVHEVEVVDKLELGDVGDGE